MTADIRPQRAGSKTTRRGSTSAVPADTHREAPDGDDPDAARRAVRSPGLAGGPSAAAPVSPDSFRSHPGERGAGRSPRAEPRAAEEPGPRTSAVPRARTEAREAGAAPAPMPRSEGRGAASARPVLPDIDRAPVASDTSPAHPPLRDLAPPAGVDPSSPVASDTSPAPSVPRDIALPAGVDPAAPVLPDTSPLAEPPVPPDSLAPLPALGPRLWLVPPPAPLPALAPPEALAELDALLARPELDDRAALRLAALAPAVPGRLRAVAAALARHGTARAVDALLALPPQVPGALEAVVRALARGVTRELPGGVASPAFLALDFRGSRARPFPDLLRRAQRLAEGRGDALRLESLLVEGRPHYRLSFWPDALPPRPRAALARAAAPDLAHLHARLARLRGTRLWLSGWCLPEDGPVSPAAQAHLLAAWLAWSQGPV